MCERDKSIGEIEVKLELCLHSEVKPRGLSHFAVGFIGFCTLGVWVDFEFGRWWV